VIDNLIAVLCRNLLLALLDDLIDELNNFASLSANHVVVMIITGHLEHRVTAFEIMTQHEACSFELGQHPVDCRQAHVIALVLQLFINVFSTQVMFFGILKDIEDLDPWQSNLQTDFS
jgi:Tat protein secretion system quality control protein TatD with DNase activity